MEPSITDDALSDRRECSVVNEAFTALARQESACDDRTRNRESCNMGLSVGRCRHGASSPQERLADRIKPTNGADGRSRTDLLIARPADFRKLSGIIVKCQLPAVLRIAFHEDSGRARPCFRRASGNQVGEQSCRIVRDGQYADHSNYAERNEQSSPVSKMHPGWSRRALAGSGG